MKAKYLVVGLVMVLVLGGAAFVAARLLQKPAQARNGVERVISASGDSVFTSVEMEMEPAPELPTITSDASGMIKRIEDNSIFITPHNPGEMVMAVSGEDGEIIIPTPEGGSTEIEVVVTQDTQVYRDVTQFPSLEEGAEMPEVMQQKVEPITLNDIGDQGSLVVWGQKRGDRIVADVMVYHGF